MATALPRRRTLNRVTPPLQADVTESRLTHLISDTGQFNIEGIESKEVVAHITWRKERGKRAIGIAGAGDASDCNAPLGIIHGDAS
jgi:hypothetical protein